MVRHLGQISFFLTLISFFAVFSTSCKKKDERVLIKQYLGTYDVVHISQGLENGHIVTVSTEQIELEVSRSCKGIRIKGVKDFDNFDVSYIDSTFSAHDKKSGESAYGQFHSNDSISLTVNLSDKLPFCEFYRMKKKK
jgi:hypothetical protein